MAAAIPGEAGHGIVGRRSVLDTVSPEGLGVLSARSRAAGAAERHSSSSSPDAPDGPRRPRQHQSHFFVILRTRTFHRDHRDPLANFPTLGIPLHLKSLGFLCTSLPVTLPLYNTPILSRMYPAAIALKLTTPHNNNFA